MIKRNKRKKAVFGIDDAIMMGIGLVNTIKSISDTKNQLDAAQKQIDQQREDAIRSSNAERASILQSNLSNLVNNQQEEQNRIILTQNSAFKLGGRRCKKCGGSRLIKFI